MSENNVIPEQTHLVYVKTLEEIVDADNKKRKMRKTIVTVALCAVLLAATFVSAFAGKSIFQTVIRFRNHDEIIISEDLKHIVVDDDILSTDNCKIPMVVTKAEQIIGKHLPGVDSDRSYEIAYEAQKDESGRIPVITLWAADYYSDEGDKTVSLFVKALTQYADSRYVNEQNNASSGKVLKENNYFDNIETTVIAYSYDDLPSRTEVEFYYEDMWFDLIFNHFTDAEIADIISRIN